jgi:hypothetical protein
MPGVRLVASVFAAAAVLLSPASAAAVRYASPAGSGTACTQASPCNIQTAVEDAAVVDGDEIVLGAGTYLLGTDNLIANDTVSIHGTPGAGRPRLESTATGIASVNLFDSATLADVEIHNPSDAATGLTVWPGIAQRVLVRMTGNNAVACAPVPQEVIQPLIRDSVCLNAGGTAGQAVNSNLNPGSATVTANLRNVTAIATGPGSQGIAVSGGGVTATGTVRLTGENVIAGGVFADILASGDAVNGTTAQVVMGHSNYDSENESANGTVTDPGSGTNLTAAPLLRDAAAGDARQLPGSPTIDRGAGDPLLGSLDPDEQPRLLGAAPDVGADEAVDPNSLLALGTGKLKRKRRVSVPGSCQLVACNVAAAARLIVKGGGAASSKVIVLKGTSTSLPAGAKGELVFKLSKAQLKRLRAARKARLAVTATAVESLGFTGVEQVTLRFRKR